MTPSQSARGKIFKDATQIWVDFTGETYTIPPDLWKRTKFRKDGLLDRRSATRNAEFREWLAKQREASGWVHD
jgi:hypothetical protein